MKLALSWIVALTLLAPRALAADDATTDWQALFDGKSLSGWRVVNGSATFEVVDGAIVGTTQQGTPNSYLATERTYGDFVLEFEVKQTVGPTNSGVQFRSRSNAHIQEGRVYGPQVDIDPSERQWTGGLYDEAMTGWWYPGTLNPQPGLYKFNEWNRIRVEAIGPSLRTWVNGRPVANVLDATYRDGVIALQVHEIDKPEEAGRKIHWRNLRIKEHPTASPADTHLFIRNNIPNNLSDAERKQGWQLLWDGKSTRGWRGAKGDPFPARGWRMKDGELTATGGGGGDIVTEQTFSAFELQLDFRLTPGANSGIEYFVGDYGNGNALGLEYQLLDDDRNADARLGTDGDRTTASLYDIQPRSKLIANVGIAPKVGEWQHARIVALPDGSVEHWLNGVKVLSYRRGSEDFRQRVAASKFKDLASTETKFGELAEGRLLIEDRGDEVSFRSIKIRAL